MIAIIPAVFLLVFISVFRKNNHFFDSLSLTYLLFSLTTTLFTEFLSSVNKLNLSGVKIIWLVFFLILILYFYFYKISLKTQITIIISKLSFFHKQLSTTSKIILSLNVLLILILLIQGIIYPPNNWDSLSYHLPRVIHWLNHNNLENYPTHIIRQLYQPTLCEYFILNFNALSDSDYFSNSVQLFFMLGSISICISISQQIFKKINYIPLLVLASTIPHALLESTSTQNDIVHSFFILSTVYFGLKLKKNINLRYFIYFGVAIGLALLSKAIAYIYLPLIVLIIGLSIIVTIIKNRIYNKALLSILSIFIVIIINLPHSYRNFSMTGDIMGTDKKEKTDYLNENFKPMFIVSTVIKNVGLHFDSFFVGNLGNQLVEKAHIILNQDINAPGSNVFDMKYNCNHDWKNHEDTQPNFFHLILFCISIILLIIHSIKNRKSVNNSLYLIVSIVTINFIFFCAMLTWEPWNTRLHLPLFFLMVICIYYLFQIETFKKIKNILLFQFLLYGYFVITFNYSRPLLNSKETAKIYPNESRFKKYFSNQLHLYQDYLNIKLKIKQAKNIGLIITNDTWEYPLYSDFLDKRINPFHIKVSNYTKNIQTKYKKYNFIVSNTLNKDTLIINHKIYKKITKNNSNIWLYKKQN
jgi:hypothetical protein